MVHERTPLLQPHPANEEKKRDADDKKAEAFIDNFVSRLEKRKADDLKDELRNLSKQRLVEQKTWADAQLMEAKRTPKRKATLIDALIPVAIALSGYGTHKEVSDFLSLNKNIRRECLKSVVFASCRIRSMDFQLLRILAKKSGLIFKYQEDLKALPALVRNHFLHLTANEQKSYNTFASYDEKLRHLEQGSAVSSILHLGILRTRTHVAPATNLLALGCESATLTIISCFIIMAILLLVMLTLSREFVFNLLNEYPIAIDYGIKIPAGLIGIFGITTLGCQLLSCCLSESSDTLLVRRANALIEDSKRTPKDFLSTRIPTLKDTLKQYFKNRLTFFNTFRNNSPAMLTQTKELLEKSMCIFDDKELGDTLENRNIKAMLNGYGIFREQTVQIEVLPDVKEAHIPIPSHPNANAAAAATARLADGNPEVADGKVVATDNRGVAPLNP